MSIFHFDRAHQSWISGVLSIKNNYTITIYIFDVIIKLSIKVVIYIIESIWQISFDDQDLVRCIYLVHVCHRLVGGGADYALQIDPCPPPPWIFRPSYGPVSVGNSSGLFEINTEASFVSSEKKRIWIASWAFKCKINFGNSKGLSL